MPSGERFIGLVNTSNESHLSATWVSLGLPKEKILRKSKAKGWFSSGVRFWSWETHWVSEITESLVHGEEIGKKVEN